MNPRNSLWRDNDVLIHWPIHYMRRDANGMQLRLTIHGASWFGDKAMGRLADKLWPRALTFDYISYRQLARAKAFNGGTNMSRDSYRAVVGPACDHMPQATSWRSR